MNMRILIDFIIVFGCVNISHAQVHRYMKEPGSEKMIKGKEIGRGELSQQQKKGFYARLVITDDTSVFERWNKPSKKFSFTSMKKTHKGVYFFPLVVFGSAKVDSSGKARVSYILKIIKPNGKVHFEKMFQAWNREYAPKTMQLTEKYLKISMDPPDDYGKYTVEAFVRDENAMVDLQLKGSFDLVKGTALQEKLVMTDDEMSEVMTYFYRDKKIDRIPALLYKFSKMPGFLDRGSHIKYFFAEVYKSFPEAIGEASKVLDKDSSFFNMFLDAVWLSWTKQSKEFLEEIKIKDSSYTKKLLSKAPEPLFGRKILVPRDLDANWAAFMGSGEESYVLNVVKLVKEPSVKPSEDMQAWKVYGAAKWSLTANISQHKKVYKVVKDKYKNTKDKFLKDALKKILGSK